MAASAAALSPDLRLRVALGMEEMKGSYTHKHIYFSFFQRWTVKN